MFLTNNISTKWHFKRTSQNKHIKYESLNITFQSLHNGRSSYMFSLKHLEGNHTTEPPSIFPRCKSFRLLRISKIKIVVER